MASYTWRRGYNGSQTLTAESLEWDEVWNVYGYVEPAAGLAALDLTADRPDLTPGFAHGVVPNAYVDSFDPVRLGTSDGWACTVHYKVYPTARDVSPLDIPAEISVETEVITVPTFKRVSGSLIVNTAGGLIYGVTRKVKLTHFDVEKNVGSIPAWLFDYSDNVVNEDAFTIDGLAIDPKKVLLQKVRGSKKETAIVNGAPVSYRVLSFRLTHNPLGWEEKVYNRGLYQKFEGRIVPCFDSDKEPTSEPMFLDEDGAQLPLPLDPASIIEIDGVGILELPFGSVLPLT